MGRRVLITRLSWFLSHRLAKWLEADPGVEYILGIDTAPPRGELERTEYLKADIRRPGLLKVLDAAEIDTVYHLGLYSSPEEAAGRGAMHDLNVIGPMHLFAACQRSETVRRVVVRSSTAVYGAEPDDPSLFTEQMGGSGRADPFGRDVIEMEAYARDLGRRRPDLELTILRFANILGPHSDTPLARYLSMPVVPTVLGYDPRLQFIHEDDAVELLVRAGQDAITGTYNAAGEGVVYLSQALRRGGRLGVPVPGPLLQLWSPLLRLTGGGLQVPPHVIRLLRWGRVADTTRLTQKWGFKPRYSTGDAVREFFAERRLRRVVSPGPERAWDRELHEFLVQKRHERLSAGRPPAED